MRTSSVSVASVSSVALTEPSSEFSIGTNARSTAPSWTAMIASCSVGSGTQLWSPRPATAIRASSLNVPSGPR